MKAKNIQALVTLVVVCVALGTAACTTTIAPKPIKDNTPSYDNAVQNSSFLGWATNGGAYITPHGRDRYNGYIAKYGVKFVPPMRADEGLTFVSVSNTWHIDSEHLVKFGQMNQWRKDGK